MHSSKGSEGSTQVETVDHDNLPETIQGVLASGGAVQMRSQLDDQPILKAVRMYWKIAMICMLAAFSAALEGYRELILLTMHIALLSPHSNADLQSLPSPTPSSPTRASSVKCRAAATS